MNRTIYRLAGWVAVVAAAFLFCVGASWLTGFTIDQVFVAICVIGIIAGLGAGQRRPEL